VICRVGTELGDFALTSEHNGNYVPPSFQLGGHKMIRSLIEEAAALTSLALFLGMVAIWAQVIATL
jgi:hypothetical protein